MVIWANHGANNRKRTTHDNYNGRQHRRPGCQHLSRRPQSPNQSCHDYLWMGDQESTSTSTTTPKNDLQKLASPHLRRHTSFWLPIEDTKDRPRGIHMTTFGRGIRNTTTTPKGNLQKPPSPQLRRQSSFLQIEPRVQVRELRPLPPTQGLEVVVGGHNTTLDKLGGQGHHSTSSTTQEPISSRVLESFGKSFRPHRQSPAAIKVPNHRTITHCRHVQSSYPKR